MSVAIAEDLNRDIENHNQAFRAITDQVAKVVVGQR